MTQWTEFLAALGGEPKFEAYGQIQLQHSVPELNKIQVCTEDSVPRLNSGVRTVLDSQC